MLLAAIDIGSNAVRLYFSNVYEKDNKIITDKTTLIRIPIRLGEDVFKTGMISEEKTQQLIKTMNAFKLLIEVYNPVDYKAFATSAMREAKNNSEVTRRIEYETGIAIEQIDGLQEGKIISSYNNIQIKSKHKYIMIIDVGGGSTEISVLKNKIFIDSCSFKIGTVRMLSEKVKDDEWKKLKKWLGKFKSNADNILCIGSGGNINKITKLYDKHQKNMISYRGLKEGINDLEKHTVDQLIHDLGLRPDRADVIIPAGKIYKFILKHTKAGMIYVPKIGLADGMVNVLYKEIVGKKKT